METNEYMLKKSEQLLIIGLIVSSFFGAHIFSIRIGGFQLTIFRCMLLINFFLFFLKRRIVKVDFKRSIPTFFLIFLLGYAILSLMWVEDYGNAIRVLFFITEGFVAFFTLRQALRCKKDFYFCIRCFGIGVIFNNIFGCIELFTHKYFFAPAQNIKTYFLYKKWNPEVMSGNANNFALIMMVGILIFGYCFVTSKNKGHKLFYMINAVISMLLMYATESRSSLLGFLMALGCLAILSLCGKFLFARKELFFLILIFGLGLASYNTLGNIYIPVSTTNTAEKIDKPRDTNSNIKRNNGIETKVQVVNRKEKVLEFNFQTSEKKDTKLNSEGVRINLIKNSFYAMLQTGGLGVGTGNTEHFIQSKSFFPTGKVVNMHNWFFEILTEFGVGISGLYILALMVLLIKAFQYMQRVVPYEEKQSFLFIFLFMISMLIGGIGPSFIYSEEWLWVLWMSVMVFIEYLSRNQKCGEIQNEDSNSFKRGS